MADHGPSFLPERTNFTQGGVAISLKVCDDRGGEFAGLDLKERHEITDVGVRCDVPLGGQRIGRVIAVEVEDGEGILFLGSEQHLLEHDVGDAILDDDPAA